MSFFATVKENWAILTFCVSITIAATTGWFDTKQAVAQNATGISDNASDIIKVEGQLSTRTPKFLTDIEFSNLWDSMRKQDESVEELEDRVNGLNISDERVRAKIELEIEKLRGEIKDAAREQQRALDIQTNVMQQILQEVKKE